MKELVIALVLNCIAVLSGLFLAGDSILFLMIVIYIVPIIYNAILLNRNYNKLTLFGLPSITTVSYCVFGYLFMNTSSFAALASSNSQSIGGISIDVNSNFLSLGQIIFVFILNFGIGYIVHKISRRDYDVKGK